MKLSQLIWNKFKNDPTEWFFYGFLLTFTLSIRKVLFFTPINDFFNEYTSIFLYLSDIFFILTLFSWLFSILNNKLYFLSNRSLSFSSFIQMFHVEHLNNLKKKLIILPLFIVILAFLSIFWAENKNLSLFRSIKLLEFYLLYLFILFNVPRGTFLKNILKIVIFIGFFQAILGIWQFVKQSSIGLFWLKESLISPEIIGVAKIIINEEKLIRIYGLFPHPNILGGFLFFSLILSFFYYSFFINNSEKEKKLRKLSLLIIFIQLLALILTFSKSAIIAFVIVVIFIYFKFNVPRGTFEKEKALFLSKKFYIKVFLFFLSIFLLLYYFNLKSFQFLNLEKSIYDRIFLIDVSRETIKNNLFTGVGMGNFVSDMQKYSNQSLENWQFQPVHNIFLLIWSELGIIGLLFFILFLFKLLQSVKNNFNYKLFHAKKSLKKNTRLNLNNSIFIFQSVLIGLIFIMFMDHYLWDIQQGQILLWLILGIIASLKLMILTRNDLEIVKDKSIDV